MQHNIYFYKTTLFENKLARYVDLHVDALDKPLEN